MIDVNKVTKVYYDSVGHIIDERNRSFRRFVVGWIAVLVLAAVIELCHIL